MNWQRTSEMNAKTNWGAKGNSLKKHNLKGRSTTNNKNEEMSANFKSKRKTR